MTWDLNFIKTYMIVNKLNSFIVEEAVKIGQRDMTMNILLNTWMNSGDPEFQRFVFDQIQDYVLEESSHGLDC